MQRSKALRIVTLCAFPTVVIAGPNSFDAEFLQEARYWEVGPVHIYPVVDTGIGYDTNIFESAKHEVDSTVTRVTPEISALLPLNVGAIQIGAQADSMRYSQSSDDNFTNRTFFGRANLEANSRNRFNLNAALNKAHDPRGTGLTEGLDPETTVITSPDAYTDKSAGIKYEFGAKTAPGRVRLTTDYLGHSYDNHRDRTRYFDRDEIGYGAAFLWRVFPSTALAIEGRERHIEYDQQRPGSPVLDSREHSALIGAEWEATGTTSGTLRVGHKTKNFQSSERTDGSNLVWEVSAKWSPRSYSRFELTLDRSPNETNGSGDFIDTRNYGLKWTHDWLKRVSTQLALTYSDQSYQSAPRDEKTKGVQVGLKYEMRHWLIWHLDASWRNRDSQIAVLDFERNRYWVTAEFRL
ncbi:MAG TPA: outer membrane beta-barrel protein [Spongiibacteraceae bacterium]